MWSVEDISIKCYMLFASPYDCETNSNGCLTQQIMPYPNKWNFSKKAHLKCWNVHFVFGYSWFLLRHTKFFTREIPILSLISGLKRISRHFSVRWPAIWLISNWRWLSSFIPMFSPHKNSTRTFEEFTFIKYFRRPSKNVSVFHFNDFIHFSTVISSKWCEWHHGEVF